MTDKEIFELWQDNMQKKVAELDKAIEMLTRLRDSYLLAGYPSKLKAKNEFKPETWRE
jgi:flagellin-specific chaperone FliS